MMIELNPLEQEALETLILINLYLDGTKHTKLSFMETRDHVRRIIKRLENKRYGCLSGQHTGVCQCSKLRSLQ